jgi:hypothetical protein
MAAAHPETEEPLLNPSQKERVHQISELGMDTIFVKIQLYK